MRYNRYVFLACLLLLTGCDAKMREIAGRWCEQREACRYDYENRDCECE